MRATAYTIYYLVSPPVFMMRVLFIDVCGSCNSARQGEDPGEGREQGRPLMRWAVGKEKSREKKIRWG